MTERRMRRARRRGAAMVEAVILLPVLAVILFGIFQVQAQARASQAARVAARRCAWEHAMRGCGDIPEGCGAHLHRAAKRTGLDDSIRPGDSVEADAALDRVIAEAGDAKPLSDIPLLGAALDGLFGAATSFTVSRDVGQGVSATTAKARFYLLCNAKPTTPWQAIQRTFCGFAGLCGGHT